MSSQGMLIGVGIGPGDPELITLKGLRAVQAADAVAYFGKAGQESHARTIVATHLRPGVRELPLLYPVTTEIAKDTPDYHNTIEAFFDECATIVAGELDAGGTVVVACEGDPMFYGSYMHLHVRVAERYRSEVIAGVTGMSGCWSSLGMPIAQGDDVFAVLPATLPESELIRRIVDADAAVLMKMGRHLPKVRRVLERTGRLGRAVYIERGTMNGAKAMRLIEKNDDVAPYFAMVLVPGWEARP
jgi:precorrin-2/cobalt-factor-2 C20-methyltransferase